MGLRDVASALGGITGFQIGSELQAGKEERRAARARRRIESRRNQRAQVAQVRQAQILRAQTQQAAASTGTMDSSGARGALASTSSTVAGNIAFSEQIQGLQTYIGERLQDAQKMRGQAAIVGSLKNAVSSAATGA